MSLIYKSKRVGKHGRIFDMYKFRTLVDGSDKHEFAQQGEYTKYGKFLRKYKLDEIPQLWNVLKGDMRIFGYRPEEPRTFQYLPMDIHAIFSNQKPGIIDLASLHFINEERLLEMSDDPTWVFWTKIKPLKIVLQFFYFENRSWLMNLAILWGFVKKILKK